jgi:hypothetical protein
MFDVINDRDDIFEATDNNDGDDAADKNSVDNQENTVDALEDNRDDLETNKMLPLDKFCFFVGLFDPDLPFFFSILWGGLVILCHGFSNEWLFEMKLYDVARLVLFESNVSELCKWICWKQVLIPMSDIFHQMFYLPMDHQNT